MTEAQAQRSFDIVASRVLARMFRRRARRQPWKRDEHMKSARSFKRAARRLEESDD